MDAGSGRVVYAKNPHAERSIASITKLMTALVASEQSDDLDEPVTVDSRAVGTEGSSMYLDYNEELPLRHLLYGLLLRSGNDAAVAIAIHIAGDVEVFAELMNQKAADLGLQHSHFANPNGLEVEGHYSSAYDMALIARAVLADPVLAEIVATKSITLGERYMENHNKLLSRYEGCIGLKTGYTKAAGRTLVSAAQRMGTTFIAVTLCDPNDWDDHTALLDYAFANYHSHLLARGGKALATVAVEGSLARAVPVVTASEVRYPLTDDEVPTVRIRLPARLKAPVLQGEVVGALVYSLDGKEIGRTDLIAAVSAPDDSAARLNTPRWSFRLPGANVFSPALPRWRGLLSRSGAFLTI
jgi:D-alanyl-D-alanine carboxypeptidase (penicillin-binding protein 5/6)